MSGLQKARLEMNLSIEQMASELCVTPKEYEQFERCIYGMPLPIVKLASYITSKPMYYLLKFEV